jgi:hypothetical protein
MWIELATAEVAVAVARRFRAAGVRRLQAYSPFEIVELEDLLELPRPRLLPYAVLAAGLSGVAVAYIIILWTNAIDYPLNVGGRPLNSVPTDIPLMFETGILFAGLTTFALFFLLSGMPRLDEPLTLEGFERTTLDRFWIGVDTLDPAWKPELADDARALGALRVHAVDKEVEP